MLTMSIKSIITWEKIISTKKFKMAAATLSKCRFTNNLWVPALFYICMKTFMSGIIYFQDILWVKIKLLMLDLLSN